MIKQWTIENNNGKVLEVDKLKANAIELKRKVIVSEFEKQKRKCHTSFYKIIKVAKLKLKKKIKQWRCYTVEIKKNYHIRT